MRIILDDEKSTWSKDDLTDMIDEELHYPSGGHAPANPCPHWELYHVKLKDNGEELYLFFNAKTQKFGQRVKNYEDGGIKAHAMRIAMNDSER